MARQLDNNELILKQRLEANIQQTSVELNELIRSNYNLPPSIAAHNAETTLRTKLNTLQDDLRRLFP